jgi:chromosome segregation ATPase
MAFFGLKEAGRYQAALAKAERQAEELQTTIQGLNQAQTQGIGELAQSDAQMRKMVQSVEARLKSDMSADLTVMAKQLKALQRESLSSVKTSDELEKQTKILQQSLLESEQRAKTLESRLDESVALLSEQVNAERTRIDGVADTRQAVMALSEEVRVSKEVLTIFDDQLNQINAVQLDAEQAVKAMQLNIDGVNEQLTQLADTNNALLGLEVLSEEFGRLATQVGEQQQILEAVDASRKQLTQRIIDLDGRVNLALSPKE